MADLPPEKSLDDFFAKRDKKKKKEKGKGKESTPGPTSGVIKKTKREKEKSTKTDNQDQQIEKVMLSYVTLGNFFCLASFTGVVSNLPPSVTICFLFEFSLLAVIFFYNMIEPRTLYIQYGGRKRRLLDSIWFPLAHILTYTKLSTTHLKRIFSTILALAF